MVSCTPCASKDDIGSLLRYIQPFLNHENQYYREGKLVISTFAGQDSKFGHHTFEDGWVYAKGRLEEITPVSGRGFRSRVVVDLQAVLLDLLHPVFLHRSGNAPFAPIHGWIFQRASLLPWTLLNNHPKKLYVPQWDGSWPTNLNKDSPPAERRSPSLDTDQHHLHHLGGRIFMAAVSPWFFTVSQPSYQL